MKIFKSIVVFAFVYMALILIADVSRSNINAAEFGISEREIVELINSERNKKNLPSYELNEKLNNSADSKNIDMLSRNYWSHYPPNGQSPWSFLEKADYKYKYAGENLAKGFNSSEAVVNGWMQSPSHKENILSKNFEEVGISVATGSLQNKDTTLVVLHFGSRSAR